VATVTRKAFTVESFQWLLVYLLVLGTPFSIYPVVATSTRGLKPFQFFALLIILLGFVRLCGGAAVWLNAATKSVLFFCGVALLSLVGFAVSGGTWSNLTDYSSTAVQLFIGAGAVFSVSTLRVERKHLRRLVYVFLGISLVVSIYAMYQSLARMYDLPLAYLTIYNPSLSPEEGAKITRGGQFGIFLRPSAFFTEPSRLGQFLLTPTLFSLFLCISSPRRWNRTYLLLTFILTVSAFILAFSMGAYIAMGGAVAVGLLMRGVRKYSIRVILTSVGAVVVLSFLFYPILGYFLGEMMWVRIVAHLQVFGISDVYTQSPFASTSVGNRLARAQEGFQVWWNHPLLGVGLNNFERFYPPDVTGLQSAFVKSLAEMGILGGIAFFALAFSSPLALLHEWRGMAGWVQSLYVGVGLGLLGRAIWMIVAGNYLLEFFWLDMVIATLLLSYRSTVERRQITK